MNSERLGEKIGDGMKLKKGRKWMLLLFTLASTTTCLHILHGEKSMTDRHVEIAMESEEWVRIAALWLCVPLVNLVVGFWCTGEKTQRITLVTAVCYFLWMLHFAFNVLETDLWSFERRALYGSPLGMLMLCSPVVIFGEHYLRRYDAWMVENKPD